MVMWRWKNTVFEKKTAFVFSVFFCLFCFLCNTAHAIGRNGSMCPCALSDLSIKVRRDLCVLLVLHCSTFSRRGDYAPSEGH